jgi:hypothetical protein
LEQQFLLCSQRGTGYMSLLQIIPLTPSLHHLHRLGALIGSWAWGPSKAKGTANHMLAEHTAPPPLRFQRARLSHKPHLVTVKRRRTSVAEHCSGAERSSKPHSFCQCFWLHAKTATPTSWVGSNKANFFVQYWKHSNSTDVCSHPASSIGCSAWHT